MRTLKTVVVVALAVCGRVAMAQTYTIDHIGDGFREAVTINGIQNGNFWAGPFTMQFDGAVPDGYSKTFSAYCVDLSHYLQSSETVTLESTNGLNPELLSPSTGAKVAYLFNTYGAGIADNAHAAGLQMAIWETLYDGGDPNGLLKGSNPSGGNVWFDGTDPTAVGYARSYLETLGSHTGEATLLKCVNHDGGYNQDLITDLPGGRHIQDVPEPGPMAMVIGLFVGMSTVGMRVRRRR